MSCLYWVWWHCSIGQLFTLEKLSVDRTPPHLHTAAHFCHKSLFCSVCITSCIPTAPSPCHLQPDIFLGNWIFRKWMSRGGGGGLVKPSPLRGGNKKTWRLLRGFPRKFLVHTVCAQVSRVAVWRRRQQAGGGGRGGKKQGFNSSTNQSGFMLCPQLQTSQQRMSGNWKTSYLNRDSMSVITINWQLLKQSISFRTGKVS